MWTIFIWFVIETVLLITSCLTVKIKSVISDLIGVLSAYLFCFHCTYDDRVDRRNSGVRSGIEWLTVEKVDALYKTSVIRN